MLKDTLEIDVSHELDVLPKFYDVSIMRAVMSCFAQNTVIMAEARCVAGTLHKIKVLEHTAKVSSRLCEPGS